MMTKFEKRVLAGIMSAMMCFSVVQMPMKDVRAEEAVQKEAVNLEEREIIPIRGEGTLDTLSVSNEELPEIFAGVKNETEITTPGEEIRYIYKAQKTGGGYLYLRDSGQFMIREKESGNGSGVGVGGHGYEEYCQFEEGKEYYIDISCYDETETGTVMWGIEEEQDISKGSHNVFISEQTHPLGAYRFVPEKDGNYCFRTKGENRLAIKTENTHRGGSSNNGMQVYMELKSGEECHIIISNYEYGNLEPGEVSWSISEEEIPEISAGEVKEFKYCNGFNPVYKFTPKETGMYALSGGYGMGMYIFNKNWERIDILDGNKRRHFDAGDTYYLEINTWRPNLEGFKWSLEKVQEILVEENKIYTMKSNQIIDYFFVPKETGTYFFDFQEEANIRLSEKKEIDGEISYTYVNCDAWSNGAKAVLEQGKTYKIDLYIGGQTLTWKVARPEMSGEYIYQVKDDNTVEIMGYLGEESSVIIPKSIEGKTVSSVGKYAFKGNTALEKVTVPACIEKLDESSFYECDNLKEVMFEENIKLSEIGDVSFGFCANLSNVVIPKSVKRIGRNAFYYSGLTEIEIPDNVTEIGGFAFAYCENLQSVNIGKGITQINDYTFDGCTQLTEVKFAENGRVTSIEYCAFLGCNSLQNLPIPASVKSMGHDTMSETAWYDNQKTGVVYMNQILYGYKGDMPENTKITVEDETLAIASGAFQGQANLKEVELPNGIKTVGMMSFFNCASMHSVLIPSSVTVIGDYAFGYLDGDYYDGDILITGEDFWEYGKKMDDFTIYGVPGSAAQQYAEENGFNFVAIATQGKGDVNDDGNIDSADLRLVLRAVCGKETLTDVQKEAADVEGDGNGVDSQDMRKILRFVCGKIDTL